jgi:hypothetical protein
MKWINDNSLSNEIEQLLNDRLQKYLDADSNPRGGENAQAVQNLILDLYVIYKGSNSPQEKFRLEQEIILKGKNWDTDDPTLAQIQKYVNRVLSGQNSAATDYLSKAIEHEQTSKAVGAAKVIQVNGRAGAEKRHAGTNKILEEAKQFYLSNPSQFDSKKQAAIVLSEKFPPIKPGTYTNKLKNWKS